MELAALLALYDDDQRIRIVWPDARREATDHVVRHVGLNSDGQEDVYRFILYSRLNADTADTVIEQEKVDARSQGHTLQWKCFTHDAPPDLGQRLLAAGFMADELEAVMVCDLHDAAVTLTTLPTPHVRRITDPEQVAALLAVQSEVWQEDYSLLAHDLSHNLRETPDQLSVYAAWVDDQPVSSAWARFLPNSQFASLWGGATLEGYRGQGHYTALLAARAQEAVQRGVRFLTVDASPMSQPILEKHGFQVISWATDYNYE